MGWKGHLSEPEGGQFLWAKQYSLLKCKYFFLEEEGITSLTQSFFKIIFSFVCLALGMSAQWALREEKQWDWKKQETTHWVRGTEDNLQILQPNSVGLLIWSS